MGPLYVCDMSGNEWISYEGNKYTLGEWEIARCPQGDNVWKPGDPAFQPIRAKKPKPGKTGKTRRMLDQAVAEATAGETVWVIGHDARQAHDLWSILKYRDKTGGGWYNDDEHGLSIGLGSTGQSAEFRGGRIHFTTARSKHFDWKFLHFTDGRIGIIHIDHYAIEQRQYHLLKELHRYDAKESG